MFQAKWNKDKINRRPKILILADRNVLKSQAMNEFNPMEKDLVDINGKRYKKKRWKEFLQMEMYFLLFINLLLRIKIELLKIVKKENEDDVIAIYKQYPSNFFDLVIIDECHRR